MAAVEAVDPAAGHRSIIEVPNSRRLGSFIAKPLSGLHDGYDPGAEMSFYIRKSVRVGPFRFNLSKSGIGVSAGVRGSERAPDRMAATFHMGTGGDLLPEVPLCWAAFAVTRPPRRTGVLTGESIRANQKSRKMRSVRSLRSESASVWRWTDSSSEALLKEFYYQAKAHPPLAYVRRTYRSHDCYPCGKQAHRFGS